MNQECYKCEPEKWAHKENGQTIMLCDEHWNALGTLSTINKPLPHTHGEHGSHTEVVKVDEKTGHRSYLVKRFLQLICLDDGVIYKEIEITREVK